MYAFLQKKISAEKFFDTPKPKQQDSMHEKLLKNGSNSTLSRASNSYKSTYQNKNNSYYDTSASGDTKTLVNCTKQISRKLFESPDVLYKTPEMNQASTSQKSKTSRSTTLNNASYNYKERLSNFHQTATSPGGGSKYEKWVKRLDAPKRPHISSNNTTPNRPKKDIKKEENSLKNSSNEKWVHKSSKNTQVEKLKMEQIKAQSCNNSVVHTKHQSATFQKEFSARKQKKYVYSSNNYELTQSGENFAYNQQKLRESGNIYTTLKYLLFLNLHVRTKNH